MTMAYDRSFGGRRILVTGGAAGQVPVQPHGTPSGEFIVGIGC